MDATVPFPNSTTRTTPLGVGLATLMREPSSAGQLRLLHAAHEAGFRHFDVAPSYGLGAAEGVLGRFLRTRPEGVTVGTKVGILARGNAGLMRALQRPARALLRRFPVLRGRATQAVGGVVHAPTNFAIDACTRSLENSLRALGTERLDLLLLHEVQPADVASGELVEWLVAQKRRGVVRSVGVATSAANAAAILQLHRGAFDAVQVPSHVLAPSSRALGPMPAALRLTHGVLAAPLALAAPRMTADPAWARGVSERAGVDVAAPGVLAQLLLAWALYENAAGIVLIGTSRVEHLRSAVRAVGAFDESRLAGVGEFLQQSLGAVRSPP
jgi:aryl-alcohol dehydrogenase-like predicted oxidoreductase